MTNQFIVRYITEKGRIMHREFNSEEEGEIFFKKICKRVEKDEVRYVRFGRERSLADFLKDPPYKPIPCKEMVSKKFAKEVLNGSTDD